VTVCVPSVGELPFYTTTASNSRRTQHGGIILLQLHLFLAHFSLHYSVALVLAASCRSLLLSLSLLSSSLLLHSLAAINHHDGIFVALNNIFDEFLLLLLLPSLVLTSFGIFGF
jgi:hypothetical protein